MSTIKRVISIVLTLTLILSLSVGSTAEVRTELQGETIIAGVRYEYTISRSGDVVTATVAGGGDVSVVALNSKTNEVIQATQNGVDVITEDMAEVAASSPGDLTQTIQPKYWDKGYKCYSVWYVNVVTGDYYDWSAIEGVSNQCKKVNGGSSPQRPRNLRNYIDALHDMSSAQVSAVHAGGGATSAAVVTALTVAGTVTAGVSAVIAAFLAAGIYAETAPYIDQAERARQAAQEEWYDITGWHD